MNCIASTYDTSGKLIGCNEQELNNIGNNISTNVGKVTNAFNLATSGQGYDAIQALNGNYKSQVGNATGTEPVQGQ